MLKGLEERICEGGNEAGNAEIAFEKFCALVSVRFDEFVGMRKQFFKAIGSSHARKQDPDLMCLYDFMTRVYEKGKWRLEQKEVDRWQARIGSSESATSMKRQKRKATHMPHLQMNRFWMRISLDLRKLKR